VRVGVGVDVGVHVGGTVVGVWVGCGRGGRGDGVGDGEETSGWLAVGLGVGLAVGLAVGVAVSGIGVEVALRSVGVAVLAIAVGLALGMAPVGMIAIVGVALVVGRFVADAVGNGACVGSASPEVRALVGSRAAGVRIVFDVRTWLRVRMNGDAQRHTVVLLKSSITESIIPTKRVTLEQLMASQSLAKGISNLTAHLILD